MAPSLSPQLWEQNFRAQMRRRREALGVTQHLLARRLSDRGLPFHQPTVQRIEDGKRPVKLDEAFVIANELGTDVASMVRPIGDSAVEGAMAVDRVRRKLDSLERDVSEIRGEWIDDLDQLLEAFREARETTNEPTRLVTWLSAWVLRIVQVDAALRVAEQQVHDAHDDPSNDVGDLWIFSELQVMVDADSRWDGVPENERPAALAALPTDLLVAYMDEEPPASDGEPGDG
ncbi:helix-turn-helix domain-containing protein [Clavibacter zhangzhiyongii]|uniref:helix-turn-helix domain-containing protein n=1 Tax=Clavibacter zhangzhiyongii TaxID=2768071 RepID=UPI0039E07F66